MSRTTNSNDNNNRKSGDHIGYQNMKNRGVSLWTITVIITRLLLVSLLLFIFSVSIVSLGAASSSWFIPTQTTSASTVLLWSTSQMIRSLTPALRLENIGRIADSLEQTAWAEWEKKRKKGNATAAAAGFFADTDNNNIMVEKQKRALDIPTLTVCTHNEHDDLDKPANCIHRNYITSDRMNQLFGKEWKNQPLLLRGLWDSTELFHNPQRRLSLHGLMNHPALANLTVPYFTDATRVGYQVLAPDSKAPLGKIVYNITKLKGREKIGSQIPVLTFPDLIRDVAPTKVVTELFGNMFQPKDVRGSGPWGLFPPWTTVPMFLASGGGGYCGGDGDFVKTTGSPTDSNQHIKCSKDDCSTETATDSTQCVVRLDKSGEDANNPPLGKDDDSCEDERTRPRTDLHCEPIGNVAVQLHGAKRWTLVLPTHAPSLRPTISRHGRAFFFSMLNPLDPDALSNVPHYEVVTEADDALWVPPWMWHRVDYTHGDEASLAASLFHFRPCEFFWNNPLFATLIVPNLIKELLGRNTE